MSFFTGSIKKEKIVAILDIGSSSVGGALVSLNGGDIPKILFTTREDMVFQTDLSLERFVASMLQTLDTVLNELGKASKKKPDRFFCVVSSPWYESVTKTILVKKDKPFVVTSQILDNLMKKEATDFNNFISKAEGNTEKMEIIDMQNIQTKLNGYETSNPYEKKVKNIETSFFIGLGREQTMTSIRDRIFRVFHSKKVTFSTFSLSAFSTIRDIFTDKDNFLFLDITGEITDLVLVKNDVLVKNTSFSTGKNFLIRRIASGFNTTPAEAMSLFALVRMGESDKVTQTRMESILLEAKKEWLASFTEEISRLSQDFSIPSTVFFTADTEVSDWFEGVIEKEEFGQFLLTDDVFDVRFLNAKMLEKFCVLKKGVKKDPFIIIETIFADKIQ